MSSPYWDAPELADLEGAITQPEPTSGGAPAILQGLNEPQQQAVLTTDGPLLIVAGPGSGKTRVITHRIAYLVERVWRRTPGSILAVTFTNKAAREMRDRLDRLLLGSQRGAVTMGTFHAVCARILRRHGERVGLDRNFTIYDQDDQIDALKSAMQLADVDPASLQPAGPCPLAHLRRQEQSSRTPRPMARGRLRQPTTSTAPTGSTPAPASTATTRRPSPARTPSTSTTCSCAPPSCSSTHARGPGPVPPPLPLPARSTSSRTPTSPSTVSPTLLTGPAPEPLRRRRPRPEHLLPGATPTSATFSAFQSDFPRRHRHQPRRKLPLHQEHPQRRRQRHPHPTRERIERELYTSNPAGDPS